MNDKARDTWRRGVVPLLSTAALQSLRQALVSDDVRLLQGATTEPPPDVCCEAWTCERSCLLGFPRLSQGKGTVCDVMDSFYRMCNGIDFLMHEKAACRHIMQWWDNTPRPEAIRDLLGEVQLALASRSAA